MKIGIIAAMPEEAHLLQHEITSLTTEHLGERSYLSGQLYGIDTTLVFSRWGKVAAAATATTLIIKYGVTHIVFTGVAGAIDSRLNIGDIIIADNVCQHDMDASPLFRAYEIPLTGRQFFNTDTKLRTDIQQAAFDFVKYQLHLQITEDACQRFSIKIPNIYTGTIASGDQFISNPRKAAALKIATPELLAVDMESAAVGQVCVEHDIPFAIIRTISDNADHSAAIGFQLFVSEIASHYSVGILKILLS